MGQKVRSANGKMIDIDSLRLMNERTIAVGNMKVNARGDQLGQGGKIIQTRNEVMTQKYKIHSPSTSDIMAQADVPNLAPDGSSFDPPEDQEIIKPVEPKLRGTLADSIAKQATVTQETLDPDMYKQKGPKRI
jgi:hypothetical protein